MQDHTPAEFVTHARAEQAASKLSRILPAGTVMSVVPKYSRWAIVGYEVQVRALRTVVVTEQQVKDWNL